MINSEQCLREKNHLLLIQGFLDEKPKTSEENVINEVIEGLLKKHMIEHESKNLELYLKLNQQMNSIKNIVINLLDNGNTENKIRCDEQCFEEKAELKKANQLLKQEIEEMNRNISESIPKRKVVDMVNKIHRVKIEQIKFLLSGVFLMISALIGLNVFYRTGYYIIHPTIYLVMILMGVGWSATAIVSIKDYKGDKFDND